MCSQQSARGRGHLHDEEQVESDASLFRPNLNRCEIDSTQYVPMGLEEHFPSRLPPALRNRRDPMLSEDLADGSIGYLVSQVGQGTLDAIVIPRRAVPRHAKNQLNDGWGYRRPPDLLAAVAVVPLLRDEHPVPAHDGVRRDDRPNLSEYLSARDLAFDRQASPLVVIEPDPLPAMRFLQDLVLSAQVFDDLLLPIDPSGQDEKEKLSGLQDDIHD